MNKIIIEHTNIIGMCGAYQLFTSQKPYHFTVVSDFIWHKKVSIKISLFAWRLLCNNRLPTKITCWDET